MDKSSKFFNRIQSGLGYIILGTLGSIAICLLIVILYFSSNSKATSTLCIVYARASCNIYSIAVGDIVLC